MTSCFGGTSSSTVQVIVLAMPSMVTTSWHVSPTLNGGGVTPPFHLVWIVIQSSKRAGSLKNDQSTSGLALTVAVADTCPIALPPVCSGCRFSARRAGTR